MNILKFIQNNGIRPADAIIVRKEKLGLFDHYVIFLGYDRGIPKFIANYEDGVKILPTNLLFQFLLTYKPVSIRYFHGTSEERDYAIQRAYHDLKTKSRNAYHLIRNNCEHFANWVQKGIRESEQVKNFGGGVVIGGLGLAAIGLESKNENMVLGGLLLALFGGITNSLGNE